MITVILHSHDGIIHNKDGEQSVFIRKIRKIRFQSNIASREKAMLMRTSRVVRDLSPGLSANKPFYWRKQNREGGAYFVLCSGRKEMLFPPIDLTDSFLKINRIAKLASI